MERRNVAWRRLARNVPPQRREATFPVPGSWSRRRTDGCDMTRLLSVAILMLAVSAPAWSQVPNPCPPGAWTTGSSSGAPDRVPPEKQAMEHSAILPDAGGEKDSAAPTVQKDGKSVEAQTECPKPPNQLNQAKPPS
jgi:hypothetical protein